MWDSDKNRSEIGPGFVLAGQKPARPVRRRPLRRPVRPRAKNNDRVLEFPSIVLRLSPGSGFSSVSLRSEETCDTNQTLERRSGSLPAHYERLSRWRGKSFIARLSKPFSSGFVLLLSRLGSAAHMFLCWPSQIFCTKKTDIM